MSGELRRRAVDIARTWVPRRYRNLPEETAAIQSALVQLSARLERTTAELGEQRASWDRTYQVFLEQFAEMSRLRGEDRAELTSLAGRTRNGGSSTGSAAVAHEPIPAGREQDLDGFYSGFEERFRGSRESVEAALVEYLPTIRALPQRGGRVLDVGPGRCEWLELLAREGIAAYGVDTNAHFVELGVALGLDVRLGDAVAHLSSLPDRSLAAVTAFQVAEHLPTATLVDLVDHSLRVLQPSGVLILETPNPLNLRVGATEFWIDPTHLHPIHPQFLEYLLVHRGFVDVRVHMTHPMPAPIDLSELGGDHSELHRLGTQLNDLLFSARDYAVIGLRAEES